MQTSPVTRQDLLRSVIAVPPLARHQDLSIDRHANHAILQHIEAGGVATFLYGGNANLYHIRPHEFPLLLDYLAQDAGDDSLVIPSVGPAYGMMMDQAESVRARHFPTSMVLPTTAITTDDGIATGFRHYVEAVGHPAVLYLKDEAYLRPATAAMLVQEGLVSFIKYAIVRDDPAHDPYLSELLDLIGSGDLIVSGIGEQPAITHLRDFKLTGFTSGCVCVQPALSQQMFKLIQAGDFDAADRIRQLFSPLEDLRNEINPIRVLHHAVSAADIADTGPLLPLLSPIPAADQSRVAAAAQALIQITL